MPKVFNFSQQFVLLCCLAEERYANIFTKVWYIRMKHTMYRCVWTQNGHEQEWKSGMYYMYVCAIYVIWNKDIQT